MTDKLEALSGRPIILNDIADTILAQVRKDLSENGKGRLPIKDATSEWEWDVGFLKVGGELYCRGGWVEDLSTVRRYDDLEIELAAEELRLKAVLGLDRVAFGFEECGASLKNVTEIVEQVEASVDDFRVDGRLSLTTRDDRYSLRLDSLTVVSWGDVKIKTGGGFLHQMLDKLLNLLACHFKEEIVIAVGKALEHQTRKALEELNINDELKELM